MAMSFVQPTNIMARSAEIANKLGIRWPLEGKPGFPVDEKSTMPYWLILEALYRYNYIRSIYGATPPYHRELDHAINDVWRPGTRENSEMHMAYANIVAGIGVPRVSYDEYTTQELKDEYKRICILKAEVGKGSVAATYASGPVTALGVLAAGRTAAAATGAGVVITGVSIAAQAATDFYLQKSADQLKEIMKDRVKKKEIEDNEYYKLTSDYN